MSVTLKDVATLANVHPSTVSRVLGNVKNVKITEETKSRVLKAVKELNYHTDQTARALRMKKSFTIGLIIPNIASPFFIGIARSLDSECAKKGYTLLISDTNEDQEKEIKAVYDLFSRGVDGLVIAPVQDSDKHIQDLIQRKFPFVLIDRASEKYDTNAVISDDKDSTRKAVQHLIDLGHKRISFISGRSNLYPVIKRLEGYSKALKENNIKISKKYIISCNPTLENVYKAMNQLMKLKNSPTAIIISGTIITLGVLKSIFDMGKSIPEDFSLIAITDTIFESYYKSPVSTISHKVKDIGIKTFEILFNQMNTKKELPYSKVIIEATFTNRNSTARVKEG